MKAAFQPLPGQVQAFFAVTLDRPTNCNGRLNKAGEIAAERAPRVLSQNRDVAQAAVDAYHARSAKHHAEVRSTWCYPEWIA